MPKNSSSYKPRSTPSTRSWRVFEWTLVEQRPGFLLARVSGTNPSARFKSEAGGHRFQRVPPSEKKGRVHTSTITVAVVQPHLAKRIELDPRDLHERFCRGTGKGGQHRNKTDTVVVLTHRPSGTRVRVDGGRSQDTNRETARERLRERLEQKRDTLATAARDRRRKAQVGSGMRGDKVRTISYVRDEVVDHRNNKRIRLRDYLRGKLADLS